MACGKEYAFRSRLSEGQNDHQGIGGGMRRTRAIVVAAALALVASPARPEVTLPAVLQVLGNVTNAARPVANALVIALNLSSFEAIQTYSGADGSFALPPLQNGIYKIIAVKH